METNERQVSNNIKGLLKRYDISREDLALRLGVTTRTLVKVINHPNRYSIEFLNCMADIIGCNINDFFMPLEFTKSDRRFYESNRA